jgi:hypothetical protein
MPKGLNALVIAPMGKGKEKEEPMAEEPEGDGMREAFDEFSMAMKSGDDDAAFEALRNFCEMCALKAGDY